MLRPMTKWNSNRFSYYILEKIIANEATDKELISEIYKQLLQLNSRKINDPINNRLVPNRKRSTSRLYIVTLLI